MNYRKFKKNAKALSPVIASIILIAVTVAVSVVVAAWMGGLTLGFMGNAEQASITNVSFVTVGTTLEMNVTVQNTGTNTVTIQSATIDGNAATLTPVTSANILKGATGSFTVTAASGTFASGAQYAFNLLTAKGHTLTYTATYSVSPSL